jgi:pimeloyl-ACP methyl ester carboxylesterase
MSGAPLDSALLTRDVFAEKLRSRLYTPRGASLLPFVVHRAARGDFGPFIEMTFPYGRFPESEPVSIPHFLSATCAEDVSRIRDAEVAAAVAGTFLADYRIRQQRAACALWPTAILPSDHFDTPRRSEVPVLLLSGAADPVTPPRWADTAATHLPNSLSVTFSQGGHVPFASPCAAALATQFLERASTKGLDPSCAKRFRRPAFVIR